MNGYQIAIICLMSIKLAIHAVKHGEEKGKYSFFHSIFSTAISVWLYIKAGLFD